MENSPTPPTPNSSVPPAPPTPPTLPPPIPPPQFFSRKVILGGLIILVLFAMGAGIFALKREFFLSVMRPSTSSEDLPTLAEVKNLPYYNKQTTKLATVAISYGLPKGEGDCRINSVDQFYPAIDYIIAP